MENTFVTLDMCLDTGSVWEIRKNPSRVIVEMYRTWARIQGATKKACLNVCIDAIGYDSTKAESLYVCSIWIVDLLENDRLGSQRQPGIGG